MNADQGSAKFQRQRAVVRATAWTGLEIELDDWRHLPAKPIFDQGWVLNIFP
jgi:hypothetical protein